MVIQQCENNLGAFNHCFEKARCQFRFQQRFGQVLPFNLQIFFLFSPLHRSESRNRSYWLRLPSPRRSAPLKSTFTQRRRWVSLCLCLCLQLHRRQNPLPRVFNQVTSAATCSSTRIYSLAVEMIFSFGFCVFGGPPETNVTVCVCVCALRIIRRGCRRREGEETKSWTGRRSWPSSGERRRGFCRRSNRERRWRGSELWKVRWMAERG